MTLHSNGLINFVESQNVEHIICCFSGGKDSLVATHITHKLIENSRMNIPVEVLHVDTTVSIPAVYEYVKGVCEHFGWKLVVVRPKKSFWELASKWGMPTPKRRWCCYRLKLEPILNYALSLNKKVICFITGLRRLESPRRKKMCGMWKREIKGKILYSYDPIIDWSDNDVLNYIKQNNLPENPISKVLGFSGECICGAFTKFEHLLIVAQNYPEFIKQFAVLEEKWKNGKFKGKKYNPFYADGKKLSVIELLNLAKLSENNSS